ncbi:N-lysine methyltransferase SETD6 isoform X2 [Impatiens glandulifera]|uniref:N-lysine methyltransferase SETD6 isoform X2 n=1 Tax=Impatiens glandulifera TaxID=253017 RepID=UPI001FB12586|nr:N-lysine methyltransferase SETD6 isoform X2 [Impatiens glandulifera]
MEDNNQVTRNLNDIESLITLELPEKDPFHQRKKELLEDESFNSQRHLSLKISSNFISTSLEALLQRARVICLDETELYFDGADIDSALQYHNPRNELEALHLILTAIDKILTSSNYKMDNVLHDLRNVTIEKIQEVGNNFSDKTKVLINSCIKEKLLLQWGEAIGVQTKLEVAYVEGAGRGAIAKEDLKVGDVALEVPVSAIISEELLHVSDMAPILELINGVSLETMLLLWSMKEKHRANSKFKSYFDSLPETFNTGLSFGMDAIMALDGTLLLEEIVQAKEHLRTQYNELFPTLTNTYPDIFPAEIYTWEQFLWACELWYSNGMKVMFPNDKLRTCLVPVAGFLNHNIVPHILRYGKVDSTTNSLKFPLSRPCNAGEQCYLSYGSLSSSHLVTFYGFLPDGVNLHDTIPLDIDAGSDVSTKPSLSGWTTHMLRGTWLAKNHGIFHYGLPIPLLDHFRRVQSSSHETKTNDQERLEIDLEILEVLSSTFEDMLENLGQTNNDDSLENTSWDVKLALEFKDLQRKTVSSVVNSCSSGIKLVQNELQKYGS